MSWGKAHPFVVCDRIKMAALVKTVWAPHLWTKIHAVNQRRRKDPLYWSTFLHRWVAPPFLWCPPQQHSHPLSLPPSFEGEDYNYQGAQQGLPDQYRTRSLHSRVFCMVYPSISSLLLESVTHALSVVNSCFHPLPFKFSHCFRLHERIVEGESLDEQKDMKRKSRGGKGGCNERFSSLSLRFGWFTVARKHTHGI